MEGLEICPQCGSKLNDEQTITQENKQTIEYSCGNRVSFVPGNFGPEFVTDYKICKNKIEWDNILIPHGGEFDESAKLIDDRFFGWIELQFYKHFHGKNWTNKNRDKNCTDKEFLDEYFHDKDEYIKKVKNIENMNFYAIPIKNTFKKDYEDWIGEVTVEEIERKKIERHREEVERVIYRVITAENKELEGGYIVENNPVGGADKSRDFYYRNILDIIIEKEIQ